MENENKSEDQGQVGKRERSSSYPASTVLESFKFASDINEKFGVIAEVSREEIALAKNIHPNTISRDIAACVQYGLLKKIQAESKYQLTQLFSDIFRYESERDKKVNLILAFGNPKLYKELIEKFDNHFIPQEFPNTLIKHHGITESASVAVADLFIKSAEEVGVLNESRILKYSVTLSTLQKTKTQYAEVIEETSRSVTENAASNMPVVVHSGNNKNNQHREVPIHLTGNKMAGLVYPSDISAKDIRLLEHAIQGILLRLELEQEDKANEEKNKGAETP